MLRGYRGIILAAFGWLILAASPEQQAANRNQAYTDNASAEALQNIASAIQQANKRPEAYAGCKAGEDARQSDLCAQWKAADAAWTSAVWTERTFWLGLVGTFIGGLTLAAAGFAAWYAREAARHTETGANEAKRGADAGVEGLTETKRVSFVTLRPWIDISVTPNELSIIGDRIRFKCDIMLRNIGQTPAVDITYHRTIEFGWRSIEDFFGLRDVHGDYAPHLIRHEIAPGADIRNRTMETRHFHQINPEILKSRELRMTVAVVANYRAYGYPQWLKTFSWFSVGLIGETEHGVINPIPLEDGIWPAQKLQITSGISEYAEGEDNKPA